MDDGVGHVAHESHLFLVNAIVNELTGGSLQVNNDGLHQSLDRAGHLPQVVYQGGTGYAGDLAGSLGFRPQRTAVIGQYPDLTKVFTFVTLADIEVAPIGNFLAETNGSIEDKVDRIGYVPFFEYNRSPRQILYKR